MPDADFEPAGEYIREIARKVLEKGLPPLTCLNVNFPDTKELKGVKICEQAKDSGPTSGRTSPTEAMRTTIG